MLKVDLEAAYAVKLHSILHFNGLPIDARFVTSAIAAKAIATNPIAMNQGAAK
jgi:hypothetical protein